MLLYEKLVVDLQVSTPESLFRTTFLLLQLSCADIETNPPPPRNPTGSAEWLNFCTISSSLCFLILTGLMKHWLIEAPDWVRCLGGNAQTTGFTASPRDFHPTSQALPPNEKLHSNQVTCEVTTDL